MSLARAESGDIQKSPQLFIVVTLIIVLKTLKHKIKNELHPGLSSIMEFVFLFGLRDFSDKSIPVYYKMF